MNSIKTFFALAFQTVAVLSFGQGAFMQVYPTTFDKTSRDMLKTPDGGYLVVGMTNNTDVTDCDTYVIKTDNMGNQQWTKTYGGSKPDYPYSMIETTDGNYFIVGFSASYGGGDVDMYLLKIDGAGNVLPGFPKTFGGTSFDEARQIIKTSDGKYVIVGHSKSYDSGNQQAVLIKIDNSGTPDWTMRYGGAGLEFGNAVKECSDGGFIITGQTFSSGQNGDTYLVRTNSSGVAVWEKNFGGGLTDEGMGVEINSDGSFVVVVRDSTASRDIDVRMMNISSDGNTLNWDKSYGGTEKDTPKTLRRLDDGTLIVAAISRSFGWINPDMWLMKFNNSGDTLWTKHYGGSDHEHCHMAKQDPNNNAIIAVGHARSNLNNAGWGQKIMFLRVNMDGDLGALSVEELSNNPAVSIYPNPADGFVNVMFSNFNEPVNVSITNILGAVIYKQTILPGSDVKVLDMSEQRSGIYTVNLVSGTIRRSQKLVIR
jgi:hypothetical protein